MGDWTGGGRYADARDVLYNGSSGGTSVRVGDVGRVPADWVDAWWISPSGHTETDGADSAAEPGQNVDVPSLGGGYG